MRTLDNKNFELTIKSVSLRYNTGAKLFNTNEIDHANESNLTM